MDPMAQHIFDMQNLKPQDNSNVNYGAPQPVQYGAAPLPYNPTQVIQDYNAQADALAKQKSTALDLGAGLNQAGNSLQQQQLQSSSDLMLQQLGLKDQQNSLNLDALVRQGGMLGQLNQIQQQRFGQSQSTLGQLQGVANKGFDLQQGGVKRDIQTLGDLFDLQTKRQGLDQIALRRQLDYTLDTQGNQSGQFALQHQDIGDQTQQAKYQAMRAHQQNQSEATTRGALISIGYARNQEDVDKALDWRLKSLMRSDSQIDINERQFMYDFKEKTAGIRDDLARGDISYDEARARYQNQLGGLQDNLKSIDLARQESDIKYADQAAGNKLDKSEYDVQYAEKQAQLQDQMGQLDIISKQTGLDKQDVMNKLNYGIQSLGLQGQVSALDLLQAQVDLQAGRFNPLQSMLNDVLQLGGVL